MGKKQLQIPETIIDKDKEIEELKKQLEVANQRIDALNDNIKSIRAQYDMKENELRSIMLKNDTLNKFLEQQVASCYNACLVALKGGIQ